MRISKKKDRRNREHEFAREIGCRNLEWHEPWCYSCRLETERRQGEYYGDKPAVLKRAECTLGRAGGGIDYRDCPGRKV